MSACLLVRLRPEGPWRIGPPAGARDRVDTVFHSDTLFSAVCSAMLQLDLLEEWLQATVHQPAGAQVRLSSLFPWQGDYLYVPAPRHLWPPPSAARLRARGAKFIPSFLVASLARGVPLEEEKWDVDGWCECLVRSGRRGIQTGPFRVALRSNAAVDRLEAGKTAIHQTACLEFAGNAGLWCLAEFSDDDARQRWAGRLEACFRLLADSGMGGERSRGWGRSGVEQIRFAELPGLLLGDPQPDTPAEAGPEEQNQPAAGTAYWLLSLFSPAEDDSIDWERGSYSLVNRSGRIESPSGSGLRKRHLKMVREGSLLFAGSPPRGTAHDVAPEGFPHPVYRSGHAVSLELPWRVSL